MPRRKPFSAKQKKEQIKDKRAVKRGELDPSDVRIAALSNRPERRPAHQPSKTDPSGSGLGSTRLQSKFTALTPEYLETTRDLAHAIPLPRPLPNENARFPVEWMERDQGRLTCPARPKFRFDQTKKQVERNEEGVFGKWLKDTKTFVGAWVAEDDRPAPPAGDVGEDVPGQGPTDEMRWEDLRSPTWFETNLEVWRQLWRVTETSHILLLLADARCPPLHLPPSLRTYVQALRPRKEVILVLTKSDLVDPEAVQGWVHWAKAWWAKGYKSAASKETSRSSRAVDDSASATNEEEIQVVTVHSYDTAALYSDKPRHRPDLPKASLRDLLAALQTAHVRLKTPTERVRSDPERLKNWQAPVRTSVDWNLLSHGPSANDMPPGAARQNSALDSPSGEREHDDKADVERVREPENEPLTIGLIGQPNVGKSSLLNAILGESRVRASRTPGKTKHFQTLFWGWKKDVKIVDCPGLVCPSLVGLDIQALCGILPISQIPSMAACILSAAHLLPLEQIFRIPAIPTLPTDEYIDKRTWRTPRPDSTDSIKKETWTAGGIMEARALDRGYLTAKGGRPDGNRAANGMMRSLADGKVRWCFFPPDSALDRSGKGIWLGDFAGDDDATRDEDGDSRAGSDVEESNTARPEDKSSPERSVDEDDSEDDGEASEVERKAKEIDKGFFAALEMDSGGSEDEEVGSDEEDDGHTQHQNS